MPHLTRITVYPIKSLDGLELTTAEALSSGALQNDRRWALVDPDGNCVNGKRCPAIHQIRALYREDCEEVTLSNSDREATFSLSHDQQAIAKWCGGVIGQSCQMRENNVAGFPDDTDSPGPTLISTATLEEVSSWFNDLSLPETRRRFRTNLEIDANQPFWEDQLISQDPMYQRFRIGKTLWRGQGVCQRCAVPTRDSQSGTVSPGFARQFSRLREAALPEWSPVGQFDHYYRLAINTKLDSFSGESVLRAGDSVDMIEDENFASNQ